MFDFGLVQPGAYGAGSDDHRTFGIEVSDAVAAARCGLGVIDPQHAAGAASDAPSAIEACLDVALPPTGARLVTIRPDLDAVGAMALISLRAEGVALDEALRARVRRIAAADRFDRGAWPGPQPMPTTVEEIIDGSDPDLAALASAVADRAAPMAARVEQARHWLTTGEPPRDRLDALRARAGALLRSLALGATRVEPLAQGRIGFVISLEPGALGLAYRLAPVVVALHPAFAFPPDRMGRKFTIAAWADGWADLNRSAADLGAIEPGWGGQRRIKGSPQDRPSGLAVERVVAAVEAALISEGKGIAA